MIFLRYDEIIMLKLNVCNTMVAIFVVDAVEERQPTASHVTASHVTASHLCFI